MEATKRLDPTHDFIFFLVLGNKVPHFFYKLAQLFTRRDITLVPVNIEQFTELVKSIKYAHVICVVPDFSSKKSFEMKLERYLKFAVKQKKVVLHHISSFEDVEKLRKMQQAGVYKYYKLPMKMDELLLQKLPYT